MKTLKNLSPALFITTFITFLLFTFSSCTENKKAEDSEEIAEEQNEEKFETRASEKDAQFLVNAAEIGLEEVELAKLAITKSTNADVKELATMMEMDHTQANNELMELAGKKGITIPTVLTKDGQDAYDKLNKKDGKDFDKEYCDMMVKGHKKAVDKFEKASEDANDGDIKAWAQKLTPKLREHLEHAKTCEDKVKK